MKITRDVIYDLLPAYFANEVSADTRALIDGFLTSDPEFGRMAKRFQTLLDDRSRRVDPQSEAAHERQAFDRTRAAAERLTQMRGAAIAYLFASAFSWFIAYLTWYSPMASYWNPGVIIGVIFLAVSLVTLGASYFLTPAAPRRS